MERFTIINITLLILKLCHLRKARDIEYYSFVYFRGVKFRGLAETEISLTFEFMVLILTKDFSCLSLFIIFRGLIEPTKTTNLRFHRMKTNS